MLHATLTANHFNALLLVDLSNRFDYLKYPRTTAQTLESGIALENNPDALRTKSQVLVQLKQQSFEDFKPMVNRRLYNAFA